MATKLRPTNYVIDTELLLKASGAVSADARQLILDMGDSANLFASAVLNVTAMDSGTGDETYTIYMQGSDSATFASGIENLGCITLGNDTAGSADVDSDAGVYVLPFHNNRNGRVYRYLALYVDVAGTTPSITFEAYVSDVKHQ